jgi:hypothetical protein
MPTKIIPIRPEPSAELIEKTLDWIAESSLGEFAGHLDAARAIWRKWRHLVEAPEFPAELRGPYERTFKGCEPSDDNWRGYVGLSGVDPMAPGFRKKLYPQAKEFEVLHSAPATVHDILHRSSESFQQLAHAPDVIGDPRFHRRRHAEFAMDARQIIEHEP